MSQVRKHITLNILSDILRMTEVINMLPVFVWKRGKTLLIREQNGRETGGGREEMSGRVGEAERRTKVVKG